jgi:hypothetical protein
MKKLALTITILCAFGAFAYAGTEKYSGKDKEVLQAAPPPCDWYRGNEWDFGFWGAYAFPQNTGSREGLPSFLAGSIFDNGGVDQNIKEHIDVGHLSNDRFLNKDNTWGGGLDVKYFFSKYWGLGLEGFVLHTRFDSGGAELATFTFRYPIGCSRFAPYVFVGAGGAEGGTHEVQFFNETQATVNREEQEFFSREAVDNKKADGIVQFGGGLEIRLLRPSEKCKLGIGLITDFTWNVITGPDNNFGMARAGVNFSY